MPEGPFLYPPDERERPVARAAARRADPRAGAAAHPRGGAARGRGGDRRDRGARGRPARSSAPACGPRRSRRRASWWAPAGAWCAPWARPRARRSSATLGRRVHLELQRARAQGLAPRRGPAGPPGNRVIERIHRFFRHAEEGVVRRGREDRARHRAAHAEPAARVAGERDPRGGPRREPDELVAEADEVQAAFGHRKLVVHDERLGARLARAFERAGWNVFRVLIMLRRRPPDRALEPGAGGGGEPRGGGRRAGRVPARAAVRLAGRGGAPARRDGRPLRPRR